MRHRCDYVVIIISSFTSYLMHKTLLNKLFGVLNVTQNILKMHGVCRFVTTRSYAALRAADLDWIIRPGESLGGYILEKPHEKPTWNHENHEKP